MPGAAPKPCVDPSRVHEAFPAPEYRGNQEAALEEVRAAFAAGNDVVLVRAPTGSGKSLLARAVAGCARQASADDPTKPVGAYYTTPQVSQLEDVAADPLLEDLQEQLRLYPPRGDRHPGHPGTLCPRTGVRLSGETPVSVLLGPDHRRQPPGRGDDTRLLHADCRLGRVRPA